MSSSNHEKMMNAVQEQQAHWVTFASKVMQNSMKLFELNARIVKESMEEASESAEHLVTAKPDEMWKLNAEKMQARLNRMMQYAKEVNAISSGLNAELFQMAQARYRDSYEQVSKLAEGARPTPAKNTQNTQQPFDFMFAVFDDASKGYEHWMDASKKLAEAAEHKLAKPNGKAARARTEAASSKKRVHH